MKKSLISLLAWALFAAGSAHAAIPVYGFVVKKSYPHDPQAFTQGLFFHDGYMYESTGLKGSSTVRKVELATGKVVRKTDLAPQFFGEGITGIGTDIIGVTWTSQVGFVFDLKSLKLRQRFAYTGEGWGLANDGQRIYMSDGSSFIRILDRKTMAETRRIQVSAEGRPIDRLNELEWVDGELFANIWGTDAIARIDPATGQVRGWIDLTGLLDPALRGTSNPDAVLNGIAYDAKHRRLFVTGKLWPQLFEIELVPLMRRR